MWQQQKPALLNLSRPMWGCDSAVHACLGVQKGETRSYMIRHVSWNPTVTMLGCDSEDDTAASMTACDGEGVVCPRGPLTRAAMHGARAQ